MLTIRTEQMHALQASFLQRFEDGRLVDIARRFPTRYANFGKDRTRSIVRSGIQLARELEIHGHSDVRYIIDLMIFFGENFHERPDWTFATAPLRNTKLPPAARVRVTLGRMGVEPDFHE